jgi:hypothetical protein
MQPLNIETTAHSCVGMVHTPPLYHMAHGIYYSTLVVQIQSFN